MASFYENTKSRWLSTRACNVYSQCGEDGLLAAILDRIPQRNRWCIEFGAWGGKFLSNTFHLVESSAYRAVLIEGDAGKYDALKRHYPFPDRIVPIHAFVGFSEADGLDTLLARTDCPLDPDVLSIDIDGNDYHAWTATEKYRPKVVIIEYNPTIPNRIGFVQPADPNVSQGASAKSLVNLAGDKGYELAAVTKSNLIFVLRDHFGSLGIEDNSLDVLRDEGDCPSVFVGYDGTIFLRNSDGSEGLTLPWHGIALEQRRAQILPAQLRTFPDNYGPLRRRLYYFLKHHPSVLGLLRHLT